MNYSCSFFSSGFFLQIFVLFVNKKLYWSIIPLINFIVSTPSSSSSSKIDCGILKVSTDESKSPIAFCPVLLSFIAWFSNFSRSNFFWWLLSLSSVTVLRICSTLASRISLFTLPTFAAFDLFLYILII